MKQYYRKKTLEDAQKKVFEYIFINGITVFPYEFEKKYLSNKHNVQFEDSFPFVYYEGKKLFFPEHWSEKKVKDYFNQILKEQDPESPHRYIDEIFDVKENDVLLDIGAAEGNFSLENINKAKKVYLFERDLKWINCLKKTFSEHKEKVQIINKYVSSKDSENEICLSNMKNLYGKDLFIKIDVEGTEWNILRGMEDLISNSRNIKVAICTYHKKDDANSIKNYFTERNFRVEFSPGYMLYFYDKRLIPPFLRKGVLKATLIKNA